MPTSVAPAGNISQPAWPPRDQFPFTDSKTVTKTFCDQPVKKNNMEVGSKGRK